MSSAFLEKRSPLIRPFYPALDGMRAIAILLVFTWHFCRVVSTSPLFLWGWTGVNIFFVLSGFLITGILMDSLGRENFFRNFYARRTLRIFPLYYCIWLVFLLGTPLLHVQWNRYIVSMAFYCGNFFKAGATNHPDPGLILFNPFHRATHGILIDHFWSLCVEEQFYLVWPLLLWFIKKPQQLLVLCVSLVIASPIGRSIYQYTHGSSSTVGVLYYNSLSRADALFLGSGVALWLRNGAPSPRVIRRLALSCLILAPLIIAGLRALESGVARAPRTDPLILTIGFSLINLASAGLLLLAIEPESALVSLLQTRPLVLIGRVSYGLYVFNELTYMVLTSRMWLFTSLLGRCIFPIAAFLVILALSLFSFRFIESPFLALKKKLAPRPGAVEDPPPASSFAALTHS